jgi:5-methylcytosine-specific restriction protein A
MELNLENDRVPEAKAGRNPSWSRDELILALDLYFRVPPSGVTEKHPEIVELSEQLQRLSTHVDPPDSKRFRNPNGVHMKMFNFKSLDPSQGGKGLANGGRLDQEIWLEYGSERRKLQLVATAIRACLGSVTEMKEALQQIAPEPEFGEAAEGAVLSRLHRYRERNALLVKKKKETALANLGYLGCEVCLFDFKAVYGEFGSGFIECHHTKPIALLQPGERTKLADLALVCANCHRMLHRPNRWLTIPALKDLLSVTGVSDRPRSPVSE